jgi:hypothetical protein
VIFNHGKIIHIFFLDCYFYLIQFSDCPFEEHALYHPLCDYILQKRGQPFVQQVLKDSSRSMFDLLGNRTDRFNDVFSSKCTTKNRNN